MKQEDELKEKRKWQIALRRYLLESQPSTQYAPYFGISIQGFRKWIKAQLQDLTWDDFGKKWQLEHIVSFQYFDITKDEDLRLCWNFLNIRVKNLEHKSCLEVNDLAALNYFESIYQTTGLPISQQMVDKLKSLQRFHLPESINQWLLQEKSTLLQTSTLNPDAVIRLNQGESLEHLISENDLLQKFGG